MFSKWINRKYKALIVTEFCINNHNLRSKLEILSNLSNSLKLFFNFSIEILDSFCFCLCWSSSTGVVGDLLKKNRGKFLKIATVEAWACSWHFEISTNSSCVELKSWFHTLIQASLSTCFIFPSFESNRIKICIFIEVKLDCSNSHNYHVALVDLSM